MFPVLPISIIKNNKITINIVLVFYIIGIFLSHYVFANFLININQPKYFVLLGLTSLLLLFKQLKKYNYMVIILAIGVVYTKACLIQNHWLPLSIYQKKIKVHGFIHSIPIKNNTTNFIFSTKLNNQEVNLKLNWHVNQKIHVGEHWNFLVKIKPPIGQKNIASFDKEAWALREKIDAIGYIISGTKTPNSSIKFSYVRDHIREQIAQKIRANLQPPISEIIIALMIGEKSGIDQSYWELFNSTGTTHLFVISGLHIGLMTAIGFWFIHILTKIRLISYSLPINKIASITGLLLAFLYATLAGFSVPVQRALIMTIIFLLKPLFGFDIKPSTAFLWSLAIVLTIDPIALSSIGFWYSFCAVGILLLISVGRITRSSIWSKFGRPQCAIFIFLFPLFQLNGQNIHLFSPVINLIAIPFIAGLIVPMVLFSLILHTVSQALFKYWLALIDYLIQKFINCLYWFNNEVPSGSNISIQSFDLFTIILFSLSTLILFSHKSLGWHRLIPFLLLPSILETEKSINYDEFRATFLDVGQGLSVIIQTKNHILLYDTGDAKPPYYSMAKSVIIPYLKKNQVNYLDKVIISHSDLDHAGGLPHIEETYKIHHLISGSNNLIHNTDMFNICSKGYKWTWDGIEFQFLSGGNSNQRSNNQSCVLKINNSFYSLLLTGDIDKSIEKKLITQSHDVSADFLLLPHHGSNYSNSEHFLKKINPKIAIISSGYMNRFHHPSKKVIATLKSKNIKFYNTAKQGTIELNVNKKFNIISHHKKLKNYWKRNT